MSKKSNKRRGAATGDKPQPRPEDGYPIKILYHSGQWWLTFPLVGTDLSGENLAGMFEEIRLSLRGLADLDFPGFATAEDTYPCPPKVGLTPEQKHKAEVFIRRELMKLKTKEISNNRT